MITPEYVWALVLGFASALVLLSNAAEKIAKAVRAAKAPANEQNARLDALEEWREEVDRKLNRDNDSNRVTQKALLALLDHGIDGNNIEQMHHAREELHNHLINR